MPPAVLMRDIVKHFPGVVANNHITFELREGEIHGLLGENGAGKTTLMNLLYGLYRPDQGEIEVRGRRVRFESPRDAIAAGIGMVHQHFMLVPALTVAENLILGAETTRGGWLNLRAAEAEVERLSARYSLRVDPRARVESISVGQQQRVEILKALYRGARLMVLDEPTAVLTPQEVEELYEVVGALRREGHTFVFISHKLNEVLRITDRITVLRDGNVVATVKTTEASEGQLAMMMVGREVLLRVDKPLAQPGATAMRVENLSARDNRGLPALRDVSFEVRAGEIVGLAGIEGNGQSELVEVLTGLRRPTGGWVVLNGQPVTGQPVRELRYRGMAHIPEDRQRRGLILDFSIAENCVLGSQDDPPFAEGVRLNRRMVSEFARRVVATYDVRTPSVGLRAATLSGGNQQKLIVGREFERRPKVLIAAQPTRGLDVGATEFVHAQLLRERAGGVAILLVSLELSEVLSLSDRILVMHAGRIVGHMAAAEATETGLGLLMAGGGQKVAVA